MHGEPFSTTSQRTLRERQQQQAREARRLTGRAPPGNPATDAFRLFCASVSAIVVDELIPDLSILLVTGRLKAGRELLSQRKEVGGGADQGILMSFFFPFRISHRRSPFPMILVRPSHRHERALLPRTDGGLSWIVHTVWGCSGLRTDMWLVGRASERFLITSVPAMSPGWG